MPINQLYKKPEGRLPNAGIFLSGTGSNAEKVLTLLQKMDRPLLNTAALVTDAPESSRARELGKSYNIPVVEHDIKKFYLERGETRVSILTPQGQNIREEWTNTLRDKLRPFALDFAIFAGFVPLTNITSDFPCMNVHPGDLTFLKNGQRQFVGLHTIPIERAILEGLNYLRSSVILVEPYSGAGSEMDNGLLLGISPKVPVDFMGYSLDTLRKCAETRPTKRPKAGYGDALEYVAKTNQNNLKIHGDWVVLPRVVLEFAAGNYAADEHGQLFHNDGNGFKPVTTLEFTEDGDIIPVI